MEAVAAHALVVEGPRQREGVVDEGVAVMEAGVEAGDLRDSRECRPRRFDAGEVVRLVQDRKQGKAPADLTVGEIQVLRLAADGLTNQQIAERVGTSVESVKLR